MARKVAVMVVHGIGRQTPDFADALSEALQAHYRLECGDDIIVEAAYWAPVLQTEEDKLWARLKSGGSLHYQALRRFLVDFMGDALAYQPVPGDRQVYDDIHSILARTLRKLAVLAGHDAPLVIIAHSLGSVIASNYLYDLQMFPRKDLISDEVRAQMSDTPLERGETLTSLYTLGSPIALWSLRYREFGRPIQVPSPKLGDHYRFLPGEWINLYDADDVIGCPLRPLNDAYAQAVTEDRAINVGGLLESWNPLSHLRYWTDRDVIEPIAASLTSIWRYLNGRVAPEQ